MLAESEEKQAIRLLEELKSLEQRIEDISSDAKFEELNKEMRAAAQKLEFEKAAFLRDKIKELKGL